MLSKNEGPADGVVRLVAGILLAPAALFLLKEMQGSAVGLVVAALASSAR